MTLQQLHVKQIVKCNPLRLWIHLKIQGVSPFREKKNKLFPLTHFVNLLNLMIVVSRNSQCSGHPESCKRCSVEEDKTVPRTGLTAPSVIGDSLFPPVLWRPD